jgi:hypothetical protein
MIMWNRYMKMKKIEISFTNLFFYPALNMISKILINLEHRSHLTFYLVYFFMKQRMIVLKGILKSLLTYVTLTSRDVSIMSYGLQWNIFSILYYLIFLLIKGINWIIDIENLKIQPMCILRECLLLQRTF